MITSSSSLVPRLSVILCTRNRATELAKTLQSLQAVDVPTEVPAEFLLLDNNSSDTTPETFDAAVPALSGFIAGVKRIGVATPGQCYARNAGLAAARGEVIVFTDDDVRFSPGWLQALTEPLLRDEADAVQGAIKIAPQLQRPWQEPVHRAFLAETSGDGLSAPTALIGANCAFHRRVLEKVPAFDTELGPGRLGFMDDTLFSWQLREAGFRLQGVLTPETQVEHHFQSDRLLYASMRRRCIGQGKSEAYLLHHWRHETITRPWNEIVGLLFHLAKFRQAHPKAPKEGMEAHEMTLVTRLALCPALPGGIAPPSPIHPFWSGQAKSLKCYEN